jgi:hypothetical protein
MSLSKVQRTRRKPHETLSLTQLRKRLYGAGVRGVQVATLAREIKAGPKAVDEMLGTAVFVLGWPVEVLEKKYGRRLFRAVTKFVKRRYVVRDEFWDLVSSTALASFHTRMLSYPRKVHMATQRLEDFGPGAVGAYKKAVNC